MNPCPRIATATTKQDLASITRIVPALAAKIGLNESILLMQLDYWISIATGDVQHDNKWWTYQTLEEMQEKAFPYWSTATISRTLSKLEDANLIHVGNFNKRKSDRTKWYALNYVELVNVLSEVDGVYVTESNEPILQIARRTEQNAKSTQQNARTILQNETTLPKTTHKTTTENKKQTASNDASVVPPDEEIPFAQWDADSKQNAEEESSHDEKAVNKTARGLIAVYLKTTKTVNSKAYAFYMDDAKTMVDNNITPAHIAEFVKQKQQEPFFADKAIPWSVLARDILTWRNKYEVDQQKKEQATTQPRIQADSAVSITEFISTEKAS